MKKLLLVFAITLTIVVLLYPTRTGAQVPSPAKREARVQITEGPELESATDSRAIIRWTSNNPGGTDVHFAVAHYGTSPSELSQTAKSPMRLNRTHSYTVFRVRLDDLKPQTTYYYTVDSMEADGTSDGVKSAVKQFSTH